MAETLFVHRGGKVVRQGIEQADADVAYRSSEVIVLKVPGGTHWSGRGIPRGYHGAEFQVFAVESESPDPGRFAAILKVRQLAEFPVRERKTDG